MILLMRRIIEELEKHDWWYMMSDSHSVYYKGQSHMECIKELLKQLPFEDAERLYNQFKPDKFESYKG